MAAVPPSCFDWPKGSGNPIFYGGFTVGGSILTASGIQTGHSDKDVVQSGAGVQRQFLRIDTRFMKNASGWGNIAGTNY